MTVASGTSTPTSITVVATSKLRLAGGKARHGGVLLRALHAAVHEVDLVAEALAQLLVTLFGGGQIALFGFLDQRADPVGAAAVRQWRGRPRPPLPSRRAERNGAGVDRLAAGRLLAQFGNVHVAEIGQHQRARDRRRGEHQHVDRLALLRQRQPLVHAEAVLLVDDGQREIVEDDVLLKQRMGADHDVDVAEREAIENGLALAAALAAGEDGDADAGGFGERRDGLAVLAGENFGRRHQRRLPPGLDDGGGGGSATTVLPEPTSPCSSRSMRCGLARSVVMSSTAFCCEWVSA